MDYPTHFIYRGHSNHEKYKLLPGVLREETTSSGITTKYSQLEYNILSDFISEACRYVKDIPVTDIPSWLEIAQHFGVPTRLMDFTQNPLVALYFACKVQNQRVKKLLTEIPISAKMFCKKRCYRKATVRLSYVVIKKAT